MRILLSYLPSLRVPSRGRYALIYSVASGKNLALISVSLQKFCGPYFYLCKRSFVLTIFFQWGSYSNCERKRYFRNLLYVYE